ncbi:probable chalcone--flavonone isomerase 3 [Hibiscus syriacus]|uniref:probable chalcone--flavonone isomerase 3 n=1 Tax=Hibiscus syriacus TaxID=106335 RepID=UPI001924D735|nr:probable chalcone--flavonone isomerase 3 [Hibiscus syriacus]
MATEMVMVDEILFPSQITTTKPLSLFGHGITDIEIHFLQIKCTSIRVYVEPEVVKHLQQWKGKSGNVLAEDDFFEALINAPVEKFLRVVMIKEIKGSQYGVQLESAVRDRLAADDKYEEDEEDALEKVVEFFHTKYFKKDSIITYHFLVNSATAKIKCNPQVYSSRRKIHKSHFMAPSSVHRVLISSPLSSVPRSDSKTGSLLLSFLTGDLGPVRHLSISQEASSIGHVNVASMINANGDWDWDRIRATFPPSVFPYFSAGRSVMQTFRVGGGIANAVLLSKAHILDAL